MCCRPLPKLHGLEGPLPHTPTGPVPADAMVRMLHFNALPAGGVSRAEEDVYKVLILDRDTKDVLAPLLHVNVRAGGRCARRRRRESRGSGAGGPPAARLPPASSAGGAWRWLDSLLSAWGRVPQEESPHGRAGAPAGHCASACALRAAQELRKHGVTLHMLLDTERQPIPDVPAVYYVQPSEAAVARIVQASGRGRFGGLKL